MTIVVRHLLGYQLSFDGPEVPVYFDHHIQRKDLTSLMGSAGVAELLEVGTYNDGEWTLI